MGLFGKTSGRDPKELVSEWTRKLRQESHKLDRQIRGIQREEEKIKRSLKEAAKKGDNDVCRIYAKQIVKARRGINKIYTSKAHINSVQLQMQHQLATIRVSGSLQKSTEVMAAMQNLVKLHEISETMREMSKEMMKAGILEEMLEETFDNMEDEDEIEDEAQEQVDQVLWELTAGTLGKAPAAVTDTLPTSVKEKAGPSQEVDNDDELEDMKSRLEMLRS